MSTNTTNTTTNTTAADTAAKAAADMLDLFGVMNSFQEHVTLIGDLGLPALPVPVQVATRAEYSRRDASISAQLAGGHVGRLAAGLLAWARTLSDVTVWFWCSGEGGMHLYVYGRMTCDTLIHVWGAADLSDALARPEDSRFATEIELSTLARWAAGVST